MAQELFELYGRCTIQSGATLWTECDTNNPQENMKHPIFFYLDTNNCDGSFGEQVYEFKFVKPITILAPFHIQSYASGRTANLFDNLYEDKIGLKWKFNTNVEMRADIKQRTVLIDWLKDKGIGGWVVPKEKSMYDMEVCVFEPQYCMKPCGKWLNGTRKRTPLKIYPGKLFPLDFIELKKMRQSNIRNSQDWSPLDHLIFKKN